MPTKDSLDFLQKVHPDGPWALTAIDVEQKNIETKTFYPGQDEECFNWIEAYNEVRNIYWHVNPVAKPVFKKADRSEIKQVDYLHVDIDTYSGSSEERQLLLQSLYKLPKEIPPPTIIVSSGGGYQAFWKLRYPIEIDGNLERAEQAARYNMQLEITFKADHCHNIDRLCRLPGTLNIPNELKRKKGRVPVWSEVVEFDPNNVYELNKFSAAPLLQTTGMSFGLEIEISGNIKRLCSIDDLDEWDVPPRTKVIIVNGNHPDEVKKGDNSRSAWLFDALCAMVRCGVPEEVMYSVITDQDFLISESVLEKRGSSERYALRQIQRAVEEAVDPWLRKLNDQFAVISNIGGKCKIVEETMDYGLNRLKLSFQSFADFRNRYLHQYVEFGVDKNGKPKLMQVGEWWLKNPKRRQFDTVVFSPGKEVRNSYNLWKGFAVEPLPGKNHESFLLHLRNNVCKDDEEHYNYLIGWMARAIQKPDSPGQTAIVLRGRQGTGKSFFANQFGYLFGRHYMQVSDPKHLVGSFNAHLRDCVILFGDEAFYAGDKKHESVLKTLITEESISIESKGIDVESSLNCTHVILASNNSWVVPAGTDERRFFVLDVGVCQMQNSHYFKRIHTDLSEGKGYNHLLYYLLQVDLTNFNIRSVPKTEALTEQKIFSLNADEEWWFNRLQEGIWKKELCKDVLFSEYVEYLKKLGIQRRCSMTSFGKFLNKVTKGQIVSYQRYFESTNENGVLIRERKYYISLPELDFCREAWDDLFHTNIPWNIIYFDDEVI